jgi:multisubunit Na+/H+ antiporter MnhB subunit
VPDKSIFRRRDIRAALAKVVTPGPDFIAFWFQTAIVFAIAVFISQRATATLSGNPDFTDPDGDAALADAVAGLIATGIFLPIEAVLIVAPVCSNLVKGWSPSLEKPSRTRWWKRFIWMVILPLTVLATAFSTWFIYVALESNSVTHLYGYKSGSALEPDAGLDWLIAFGGFFILVSSAVISIGAITGLLRRL